MGATLMSICLQPQESDNPIDVFKVDSSKIYTVSWASLRGRKYNLKKKFTWFNLQTQLAYSEVVGTHPLRLLISWNLSLLKTARQQGHPHILH
jgi:hypothetical protein